MLGICIGLCRTLDKAAGEKERKFKRAQEGHVGVNESGVGDAALHLLVKNISAVREAPRMC